MAVNANDMRSIAFEYPAAITGDKRTRIVIFRSPFIGHRWHDRNTILRQPEHVNPALHQWRLRNERIMLKKAKDDRLAAQKPYDASGVLYNTMSPLKGRTYTQSIPSLQQLATAEAVSRLSQIDAVELESLGKLPLKMIAEHLLRNLPSLRSLPAVLPSMLGETAAEVMIESCVATLCRERARIQAVCLALDVPAPHCTTSITLFQQLYDEDMFQAFRLMQNLTALLLKDCTAAMQALNWSYSCQGSLAGRVADLAQDGEFFLSLRVLLIHDSCIDCTIGDAGILSALPSLQLFGQHDPLAAAGQPTLSLQRGATGWRPVLWNVLWAGRFSPSMMDIWDSLRPWIRAHSIAEPYRHEPPHIHVVFGPHCSDMSFSHDVWASLSYLIKDSEYQVPERLDSGKGREKAKTGPRRVGSCSIRPVDPKSTCP
ncbi:hypothetical protein BDZ85DRAFT_252410 [Elsinoe ampelina]|uniref:Uncharacterized protein n=1 Tax=Elsinoe ampelina TaxID=302913 RepID=A0A6A6G2K8_9PEZI|nr:hypothetical protein BDZ85DRAFT_252410 [Elsinoe ampelina]